YKYLFDSFGEPSIGTMKRFKAHMILWGLAGLGILCTLPFGITSGREYLDFHPLFSLFILLGWLLFAWNFFSHVWKKFWERPIYVYMWACGILLFIVTFLEGHAYLLPGIHHYPIVDLQIQWKSCGSLVAAFNQMVYGSLFYVGERLSQDSSIAHSKKAFFLFGIGLLNSFTNFAHHTYHLPQSHLVKWIAFSVSMLEIIILVQVYRDVVASIRNQENTEFQTSIKFIHLSKCWNLCLLFLAILISVPPLNSLIHGTHVVMAHAMGSELAIDSYILFAVFASLITELFPQKKIALQQLNSLSIQETIYWLNGFLICLVSWLLLEGLVVGYVRFFSQPVPAWWKENFSPFFVFFGVGMSVCLIHLLLKWLSLLLNGHFKENEFNEREHL
ncbi:MAG: hypothetical protein AABZ60_20425, partial [Planctomycetota bacterium]